MPIAHYEEIHKAKIEYQIHERYHKEIQELETLGFHDLYFTREVTFPFSVIFMFWAYFPMKAHSEIFQIEKPFRFVLLNPLLLNRDYDCYVNIFGMGAKFVTLFQNGGVLYSCNYPTNEYFNSKKQIYRYAPRENISIAETWENHQARIEALEASGLVTDNELHLAKFERVMALEDKILLTSF